MTFPHLVTVSLPSQTQLVTLRFNGSETRPVAPNQEFTSHINTPTENVSVQWNIALLDINNVKTEHCLDDMKQAESKYCRRLGNLPRHNPPLPYTQPEKGSQINDKLFWQLSTLRGQLLVSGRAGSCNKRKEQTRRAKPPFPNMVHSCQGPRTLPLPSPSLPSSRLSLCPPYPSHFPAL